MAQTWIKLVSRNEAAPLNETGADSAATDTLVGACLAAAASGDNDALFDLGVAFSTGSHGAPCDLIEAHKWFNLAAVAGHEEAALCRAEVSDDMTAREIAEAQRRAREWLRSAKPDIRAA
jgi:TPR repeat protein